MTIAIIDYKAGNCTSVLNAFASLGVETVVTREADVIAKADRIVFPGVGAAKSAMENLAAFGLTDIVREQALSGKPFLGICLGMQILFEHSEEDGGVNLLNILPGKVKRFPDTPGFKIPEIGWNQVNGDIDYYFVHSYYASECEDSLLATAEYGAPLTAAVARGNVMGCQFHPEKSGEVGMRILRAFAEGVTV